NVLDPKSDAPGADDDASGTAAVIEMACAMSRLHFDATLVFMAVAGEEQGLVGSTHVAEEARKAGKNIAGMFTNDIIGNSRLETARLENDTTLHWDASTEPDLAGYRIVWRDTTAPLWQNHKDVGLVTRYSLPLSKDNVVFGVQAIDKDGNVSVASYPTPVRPPQPGGSEPASGQPASGQPASGQPASGQPASGQPASGQPASGQPPGSTK